MMLSDLLHGETAATKDLSVTGLALSSKEVVPGSVFIALAGSVQHGLLYAHQAIANGAAAIIYDPADNGSGLAAKIDAIPTFPVVDLGVKLGTIASRFYNNPSQTIDVIGITGTNGKTSCSHFLSHTINNCAIIGTLGWGERNQLHETANTTPDALSVQRILFELLNNGKQAVAMEVSSHALQQGRVNGVNFKGVVFTNISRDHLDYHGTMEAYLQAKLALLDKPGIEFVVINLDDAYNARIIERIPKSIAVWGISASGKTREQEHCECVSAEDINLTAEGINFTATWRDQTHAINTPLYGSFNVDNVLITMAVTLAMGHSLTEAAQKLDAIQAVAGRMQAFGGGTAPLVFVDYAHTPDALDKVLSSVRQHCQATLWLVFGCGGNRDTGKRPQMGLIAEQRADKIIVTDDNPRFEDSTAIINDIVRDCTRHKIEVVQDRTAAIRQAVLHAKRHDCIVIAGKGHETYQEIQGVRLPFSDKHVVMEALTMRGLTQ